jgi:hypothetical protein
MSPAGIAAPVLDAYRDGAYLVVWCDHCLRRHYHGAGGNGIVGYGDGHRSPHCSPSRSPHRKCSHGNYREQCSPYSDTGYVHEVGTLSAADSRRKGPFRDVSQ